MAIQSKVEALEHSMRGEFHHMKAASRAWFTQQTSNNEPEDGFDCMWRATCGQKICGKVNFWQHLTSHVQRMEEAFDSLLETMKSRMYE